MTIYRAKEQLIKGHCEIWAWGAGGSGQLGLGPVNEKYQRRVPTRLDSLGDLPVRQASCGDAHTLIVARNEASWGLMRRLGMQRREDLDFANAEFDPEDPTVIVYSITPDAWRAARDG